ncbi:MAG TPA: heme-binding protein [Ktedonobacteraceae bacterium]
MNLTIDIARRVLEASKQRAMDLRSPVSIAIVDAGGHLVLFERMMSPYGWATGNISIAKANTAVMFNQSTDAVAQWGSGIPGFASSMATMSEGKFIMAAGGWPIRVSGATIGGIGVSGGNAPGRDDDIARAGLAAAEAMYQSQPVGPVQQRPALQPTPSYPSIPSPAGAQFNAPNNPSPAPQNVPNSTHHLDPDQDGSYGYEEEQLPFEQYNESRGGQP